MSTSPLSTDGSFGRFADRLLAVELPDLPSPARSATVDFVCRRARQIPSPLRAGVTVLATGCGAAARIVGPDRVTAFLRSTQLPFVGELARMVRSLGFTFVWETWPATSPTGAPPERSPS